MSAKKSRYAIAVPTKPSTRIAAIVSPCHIPAGAWMTPAGSTAIVETAVDASATTSGGVPRR